MTPTPVSSKQLESLEGIRHGFFTRQGGVSSGIYKSLNVGLGSNDRRDDVMENRHRVARFFGRETAELNSLYQIHSNEVITIDRPISGDKLKADALVTATPGLVIGALTADCGPVLFADATARIVGAAHAGWKGATGSVLDNTILAMEELGANRDNIHAALGPTISQQNYEVGPEFVDNLLSIDPAIDRQLIPSNREGHAMFDLQNYIIDRLQALGVSAHTTGHCTYANEERFFSYRRTTHRQEPDYGRQISAICLV